MSQSCEKFPSKGMKKLEMQMGVYCWPIHSADICTDCGSGTGVPEMMEMQHCSQWWALPCTQVMIGCDNSISGILERKLWEHKGYDTVINSS